MRTALLWASGLALLLGAVALGDVLLVTPERVAHALMEPGAGAAPDREALPGWVGASEPFRVETSDGVSLSGWFLSSGSQEVAPRAVVIICHGVGSNHWGAIGLAQTLHRAGDLAVVLFDFRGHGLSERVPFTYGAHETRDIRAIVDWTRARSPGVPIRLVGWSAGAVAALLYASEDSAIDRIIVINPFASMEEMAYRRRPFFVMESVYRDALRIAEAEANFRIADVSPVRVASRVRGEVLVIVGEADRTIPPDHGHRVHESLGTRSTLWSLPGIGHDDWWTHPDFGERLVHFLRRGERT